MENPHLSRTEDGISKGLAGLKSQVMPSPPAGLVDRMIAAEWPRRGKAQWVWHALAACGGLAIVGVAVLPRSSSAAVALERLVEAHQRSDVLFRVTPYWIEGKNRTPKVWSGYVKGKEWRYVQSNLEQASDGKQVTMYFPTEGKALVWTLVPGESNAERVLGDASLSWWRSSARRGLTVEHNVKWNGLQVDRYVITTTSKDWGPTTSTLYADPVAGRPLYQESIHASGNGNALAWDYLSPTEAGVLRIKMRAGTKIEDITAQRELDRRRNAGQAIVPSKAAVGD